MDCGTAARNLNKRRRIDRRRFSKSVIKRTFGEKKNFLVNILNGIAERRKIKAKARFLNGGRYTVILENKEKVLIRLFFSSIKVGESFNPSLNLEGNDQKLSIINLQDKVIEETVEKFVSRVL